MRQHTVVYVLYLTSRVLLNPMYLKMLILWMNRTFQYTVLFSSALVLHWLQYLQFCIIRYMYSSHLYCDNKTLLKHCLAIRETRGYCDIFCGILELYVEWFMYIFLALVVLYLLKRQVMIQYLFCMSLLV